MTCSSHGTPREVSLEDLQNIDIGSRFESNHGCCPNIPGGQGGGAQSTCIDRGFDCPGNGEFEWGGRGSACSMCSFC